MELLLINEHKLKIMLTAKDMDSYGLTKERFDYSNTETRKALWDIFDYAKYQTGFDAASDKIYIQVFTSEYGGCEMFVTKPAQRKCEDEVSFKIEKQELFYRVYSFANLENLLSLCRVLSLRDLAVESSVYSDGTIYYLVLCSRQRQGELSEYTVIEDYCIKREKDDKVFYIREHCSVICKGDAIDVLAPL